MHAGVLVVGALMSWRQLENLIPLAMGIYIVAAADAITRNRMKAFYPDESEERIKKTVTVIRVLGGILVVIGLSSAAEFLP